MGIGNFNNLSRYCCPSLPRPWHRPCPFPRSLLSGWRTDRGRTPYRTSENAILSLVLYTVQTLSVSRSFLCPLERFAAPLRFIGFLLIAIANRPGNFVAHSSCYVLVLHTINVLVVVVVGFPNVNKRGGGGRPDEEGPLALARVMHIK